MTIYSNTFLFYPQHTVCLLGTFQDATRLYVASEVVMGGELFNRLARVGGAISEDDAKFYTACVTLGLQLSLIHI